MVKADKTLTRIEVPQATKTEENEKAMKLVAEMLAGKIIVIRPQFDFTSEMGFIYPEAEQILEVSGEAVVSILETLVSEDILVREFFDKLFRCPQCQSINLRPTTHCTRCSSANIVRGRVLEHFICKHVELEDEFIAGGKYICPKCKVELRTIGNDYQSLGLLYKCRDCGEIFNTPLLQWRCMNCAKINAENEVAEINIYSYSLNEVKRRWLEFELKPKLQLIEFLKQHGYEVTENVKVKGRSGAAHNLDMLASRDDGIVTYNIAIGVKVAGEKIGLEEIFDFDDKAYDIGIHDKILIVLPGLHTEAEKFARQQRIKVLGVRDLETVLTSSAPQPGEEVKTEAFEFKSKSQLIEYLGRHGYQVKENSEVKGWSGAMHNIDILASRDDGLVTHNIDIGIEVAEKPVELDKVFDFDDKAYDIGILDKVLIAVPGLTQEAKQFAQRQRIRVFEVTELEPSG